MTATLDSLRDRVETLLQDGANLIYDPASLDEMIRLAVGEYVQARGAPQTLSGLDGAVVTSIPVEHEVVIVIGAVGYAVTARVHKRAESYQMHPTGPVVLAWAERRLAEFRALLERVRLETLQGSLSAPWGETGWKLDAWDGE